MRVIWLHGLGDSGDGWSHLRRERGVRAEWQFPTAPPQPVSCNGGHRMTSWMDLEEIPVTHPERFDDAEGLQVSKQRARMEGFGGDLHEVPLLHRESYQRARMDGFGGDLQEVPLLHPESFSARFERD